MPKQYNLIHLGTGEQVFGIHSKAWFIDRLSKWDIYNLGFLSDDSPAKWQLYKKSESEHITVVDNVRICNPIEFELFEVTNGK